ncbi:hypothetical protein CYLTODRAFT_494220 [Cylindrobasidium torrendii FP15055 ss-10]|uniref:Uncharacterized protein n=1 Tax=Cylindrobasidium torrendii FP15055 ss-10 TaxID=1314674 RepID=A0A0D7AYS3_9AGAR|nr:hypothetical protein CYLTODRAFT_494220 [Cylindrobasidium torrendii FP15055 ss-10]
MQSSRWQKYTHGIVGGVFPDPNDPTASLIISSPNMMTLPNPLVHTQRVVRALKDAKWGIDDPTLHPQVFRNTQGHLPLILAPQLGAPGTRRVVLHAELAHDDWIPTYKDSSFGTIEERLASTLEAEAYAVVERFEGTLRDAELTNADAIGSLSTRKPILRSFKNAINRLSIPGARNDCVWLWASVQRYLLDLQAFLDWHDKFRNLYINPPDKPLPVDKDRLGAITSNHESAEVLYRAGLPTYFIRRVGEVDLTAEIQHLLPDNVMQSVLNSTVIVARGQQVGTPGAIVILKPSRADNSPIVFRGDAKNPHRMAAMMAWLRRDHPLQHPQDEWTPVQIGQLKEFGIYDPSRHHLPSQTIAAPAISSTASTSSVVRASSTISAASGSYTRKSNSRTSSVQPASKKWVNDSKYLSAPLGPWIEAAKLVGRGHNDSTQLTWPGAKESKTDWRGYAFPDAGMLANMTNDNIRNGALCSYVHHRPAFVYRIQSSADCALKLPVWRSNLVACTLRASAPGSTNDIARKKAEDELNKSIRNAGFEGTISLQRLPDRLIWQGAYIDPSKPLSLSVTRSILSDMNEVEWRWEFVNLDSKLYDPLSSNRASSSNEASQTLAIDDSITASVRYSQEDRRLEVLQSVTHFNGQYVPHESFYKKSQGLASRRNSEKSTVLLQLATVMSQWRDKWRISDEVLREVKGLTLMHADELDEEKMNTAVNRAEGQIAMHYISCFKDVFSRAPTLPRETKTWPIA